MHPSLRNEVPSLVALARMTRAAPLRRGSGLAAVASLLAPGPAWACSFCAEQQLRIEYPFLAPANAVLVAWFATTVIAGLVLDGSVTGQPAAVPTSRLASSMGLACGLACFLGGLLAPSLGLAIGGALFVLVVLGLCVRSARARPLAGLRQVLLVGHAGFAALLVGVGLLAHARRDDPARLVDLLGSPVSAVTQVVLPRLLAQGAAAVPPLERKARALVTGGRASESAPVFFALERLCSPQVEALLADVVAHASEPPPETARHAWLAWARCGGEPARSRLRDLFRSLDAKRRLVERSDALVALVRSGDAASVLLAIEHLDELREVSTGAARGPALRARLTLSALARGTRRDDLLAIRAYAVSGASHGPRAATDSLFDELHPDEPEAALAPPAAAALRERWAARLAAP
ncbi:MAG: hypothetical protein INH37_00955 [Myxococcaceae bacterium]|nr:hypothetical protein [Myxococcaceae bacterium]